MRTGDWSATWALGGLLVAACGRLDFESLSDSGAGRSGIVDSGGTSAAAGAGGLPETGQQGGVVSAAGGPSAGAAHLGGAPASGGAAGAPLGGIDAGGAGALPSAGVAGSEAGGAAGLAGQIPAGGDVATGGSAGSWAGAGSAGRAVAGEGGGAELGGFGGEAGSAGQTTAGNGVGGNGGVAGYGGAAGAGGAPLFGCESAIYDGNGHPYQFCASPLSWNSAKIDCEVRGMQLVRLDAVEEDTWVWDRLSALPSWGTQQVWYGGSDADQNGDWYWSDGDLFWSKGALVSGFYEDWSPGRPNTLSATKNCLAVKLGTGKEWFDLDCLVAAYYVCEQY